MMTILNHPHTVWNTEAAAAKIAASNTAGDEDGWTYTVRVDPNGSGRAIIEIHDETGEFVGLL
jgi:phosphoribosylformylglycinamidine (FGAM) synthase-like amidotransferase family enzyme